MGKTSFALNIATRVAMQQKVPVAIFSLEMTKEQLTNRILSADVYKRQSAKYAMSRR